MAKAFLFEKLEKEHQTLFDKIDELDRRITEVLDQWTKPEEGEESMTDSAEGEEALLGSTDPKEDP